MLTAAELPNFVRDNPPSSTAPPTALPLAREARQFFLSGEPELADRYFPWLVNIMSPAYWVYLVMAVTTVRVPRSAGHGSKCGMPCASLF
jgi:hypothetical protein